MLKEEVTHYAGLPGHFKDEETMYQLDITTGTEELGTDHYGSEDPSDMFIGPAAEDFIR